MYKLLRCIHKLDSPGYVVYYTVFAMVFTTVHVILNCLILLKNEEFCFVPIWWHTN